MSIRESRILKEINLLSKFPLDEVEYLEIESQTNEIICKIQGPEDSRFAGRTFLIEIHIGSSFPFEPPTFRFRDSIRHPNIDEKSGRICLDLLKMPPEGSWRPNLSLGSVLTSIRLLLSNPNLEDPINPEIADEWHSNDIQKKPNENHPPIQSNTTRADKRLLSLSFSDQKKKIKSENK